MFTNRARQILNVASRLVNRTVQVRRLNGITNKLHNPAIITRNCIAANSNLQICRCKHKDSKKRNKPELSESDEEEETEQWDSELQDKQTKVMSVKINSLRADLVLKAGLGIARNKIETMFYESKIRVNGQKLLKKSTMLSVGDEVDIVRGTSAANPEFLTVSRVEILSANERGEGLSVKLRRNKALTVENYAQDPHKG